MKITMINGSPKAKDSASGMLLATLREYLGQEAAELTWNKMEAKEADLAELSDSDAVVIAFPLYIDSVPSHLLRCMMQAEEYMHAHEMKAKTKVYVIVNNGFFQGKQNLPVIEVMRHWADRCGFIFGQAVGIGGGGMLGAIRSIPDGHGPKKNITAALRELSGHILKCEAGRTLVLEPNYPAWAYKWQAQYGWRQMAKRNGLKLRDLGRQW